MKLGPTSTRNDLPSKFNSPQFTRPSWSPEWAKCEIIQDSVLVGELEGFHTKLEKVKNLLVQIDIFKLYSKVVSGTTPTHELTEALDLLALKIFMMADHLSQEFYVRNDEKTHFYREYGLEPLEDLIKMREESLNLVDQYLTDSYEGTNALTRLQRYGERTLIQGKQLANSFKEFATQKGTSVASSVVSSGVYIYEGGSYLASKGSSLVSSVFNDPESLTEGLRLLASVVDLAASLSRWQSASGSTSSFGETRASEMRKDQQTDYSKRSTQQLQDDLLELQQTIQLLKDEQDTSSLENEALAIQNELVRRQNEKTTEANISEESGACEKSILGNQVIETAYKVLATIGGLGLSFFAWKAQKTSSSLEDRVDAFKEGKEGEKAADGVLPANSMGITSSATFYVDHAKEKLLEAITSLVADSEEPPKIREEIEDLANPIKDGLRDLHELWEVRYKHIKKISANDTWANTNFFVAGLSLATAAWLPKKWQNVALSISAVTTVGGLFFATREVSEKKEHLELAALESCTYLDTSARENRDGDLSKWIRNLETASSSEGEEFSVLKDKEKQLQNKIILAITLASQASKTRRKWQNQATSAGSKDSSLPKVPQRGSQDRFKGPSKKEPTLI